MDLIKRFPRAIGKSSLLEEFKKFVGFRYFELKGVIYQNLDCNFFFNVYTFGLHSTNTRGSLESGEEVLNRNNFNNFPVMPFLVKLRTHV